MKTIILGIFSVILCAPTLAAEGRWTEGYGQGNLEYFIDIQGVRLYIGCPTQDGSADSTSSVSLYQVSNHVEAKQFSLTVNGITYQGPFEANSRVGTNNFVSLLEGLQKGDAVVRVGNKSITYPKSNAAKILPIYGGKGSKKFNCNLM